VRQLRVRRTKGVKNQQVVRMGPYCECVPLKTLLYPTYPHRHRSQMMRREGYFSLRNLTALITGEAAVSAQLPVSSFFLESCMGKKNVGGWWWGERAVR
jgi:hypothetical protein